jgi:hypothetical protein
MCVIRDTLIVGMVDETPNPEILPKEPKSLQIGEWVIPASAVQVIKTVIKTTVIFALLGWAAWSLQNFLQLRGVVNVLASRINLAFLFVTLFVVAWILTVGFRRKALWRVFFGLILLAVVCGFDWLAPKPLAAVVNTPQPNQSVPVAKAESVSSPPEKDMRALIIEVITEYNKTNPSKPFTPSQMRQIATVFDVRSPNSVETDEQLSTEAFWVYAALRSQAAMWNSGHVQYEGATRELMGALVPDGHGGARHMNQEEMAAVRKQRDPGGVQQDDAARKRAQPVVNEMLGLIPKITSRLKPYEQSGVWQMNLWNKVKTDTYGAADLQIAITAFADLQKIFANGRGFKAVN